MLKKGLIQVYTSASERVNFAPFGLALRAAGQDFRVHVTSLLPHEWPEGAVTASRYLKPNLVIHSSSLELPARFDQWNKSQTNRMRRAFEEARKALLGGDFDLVILNGVHPLCDLDVIALDDVLSMMREKPDHVELVLEGRGAHPKVLEGADLVTEMVCTELSADQDPPDKTNVRAPAEVVTGNGKGKTTYCLGKAMLISATGIRSTVLQFIKSPRRYGEVKAIEKLPNLDIRSMGKGFVELGSPTPKREHLEAARQTWEKCLREIFSLKYGLVVLDEINIATDYGLVKPERVREMMFLKPRELHLILSGRNAHEEVRRQASLMIEMREIKHPFQKGVHARRGIEF